LGGLGWRGGCSWRELGAYVGCSVSACARTDSIRAEALDSRAGPFYLLGRTRGLPWQRIGEAGVTASNDFSKFAVATGLPAQNNGSLSYDNLYYPGGSPQTASDYPPHGGFLDIYGLMFNIGGGRVVNFWSNGVFSETGTGPADYGAAVATQDAALDYVAGGVVAVPEPSTYAFMLAGLGVLGWVTRRRKQG
jgi:hypothetical protein